MLLLQISVLFGAIVLITVLIGQPDHMKSKRTHLFETKDGEKYNPFSEFSDEVTDGIQNDDWTYPDSRFE